MSDLWATQRELRRRNVEPLAVRMRPRTLDEFVGQQHFLGEGGLLRRMLNADSLTSVIFWGPPGTGKTTLAEVIARSTNRHFERANAALVGVKDIRSILDAAAKRLEDTNLRTILLLDEIHRFARNQQDVLLHDVEGGLITLIGATTENPYFSVNSALNSRSTLFQFEPLTEEDISSVIRRAIADPRGFGELDLTIDDDAVAHWARISDGDARRALNALEVAVLSQVHQGAIAPTPPPVTQTAADSSPQPVPNRNRIHIDLRTAEQSIQHKALVYDGTGDEHYDIISAFIKSMRGSDPDATIYWLARMLSAGEDPRFIARRISILASEDIGNADPNALVIAASAYSITERIGMPECQLTLAQAAIYMSLAPKSNASAAAIWSAAADVREQRTVPVPRHLRDTHYKAANLLGHGKNYQYPHEFQGGFVDQEYLGVERRYYQPTERGFEKELDRRLKEFKRLMVPPGIGNAPPVDAPHAEPHTSGHAQQHQPVQARPAQHHQGTPR